MQHTYSYEDVLAASERVNWRVEDIIGGDRRLDFTKAFLPEPLARVEELPFLNSFERRTLNQIRANTYLCMFGIVEEFILPFVLDHARPQLREDDYRVRALLQFAGEEAKHIQLFKRFREDFEQGFGTSCAVIGPADEIARAVLAHDPLSVALTVLHIEWMSQRHFVDSVKDDTVLDPQFKSLLKHHWMEEAQHAKIDTMMVEALADGRSPESIEAAVEGYLEIGGFLDAGLAQQVELDLQSLTAATGRTFSEDERAMYRECQMQANRWTYLGSGMTHPNVLKSFGRLGSAARERLEAVAPAFC
jgi:hypothetical protein